MAEVINILYQKKTTQFTYSIIAMLRVFRD